MDIILAAAWIMSFFYLFQKIMKLKKIAAIVALIMLITILSIVCPKKDLSVDELSVEAVFDEKSGQYILFKKEN